MSGKKLIRNFAALLGYGALSLGIFLLILALVTQTAPFRRWLASCLVQEAQARFGLALSLDRIGGNLLTGLTLRKVELRGKAGERLALDQLKVRFSPVALLFRRMSFPLVSVSGLRLTVIRTKDGSVRVLPWPMGPTGPSPAQPSTGAASLSPFDVRIQSLLIRNGSLTFRDYFQKEQPMEISVQGIQADLSLGLYFRQGAGNWEAQVRTLSLSLSPYQFMIQKIQGGIIYRQGSLEITGLKVLTSQSQVELQGRIYLREEPFFDVQARFPRISLSELQRSILARDKARLPPVLLRLFDLQRVEGEAKVRGTLKDLDYTFLFSFEADKRKGQWQTAGNADFSDQGFPRYNLRTRFRQFPVSWWLPPKQRASLTPYIDLTARIKGEGIRPGEISAEFEADVSAFTLFGQTVTALDLSGQVDGRNLRLTKLYVYSPAGRARLEGQIDLQSPFFYQLTLSFQQLNLEGVKGFPSTRLAGEAQLQGSVGQKFPGVSDHRSVSDHRRDFQAAGSIRLLPSRLGERFLDSLLLEGDFEAGVVRLSQGRISMEGLDLSLAGIASRQQLRLAWSLRELDLAQLKGIKGVRGIHGDQWASLPEGVISGRGKITGNPKSPHFEGELAGRDIIYRGYRASSVVVKGRAGGGVSLEGIREEGIGSREKTLSPNPYPLSPPTFQTLDFDTQAQISSLMYDQQKLQDSVKLKANKKGSRVRWQVQGIQEGKGTQGENRSSRIYRARGLLEIPQMQQGSARIDEVSFPLGKVTWRSMVPIQVEWDAEALRIISLKMGAGQGQGQGYLFAQGEIRRTGQQKMQIQLSGFPLEEISTWAGRKAAVLGTLDGEVRLSGTRSSPKIEGKLEVVKGKWSALSFDRLVQIFAYSQKKLTVIASMVQAGKETLHLTAKLPVDLSFSPVRDRWSRKGIQMKASIQEMDLSFLPAVLPVMAEMAEVKGAISGTGEMTGSLTDPRFELKVGFMNTSFRIRPLLQVFKVRKAIIRGNSQRIVFEEVDLAGKSGSGKFSGAVELSGLSVKGLKARVRMDQWKIAYSRDTYFVFNGELAAQGGLSRISLTGRVLVPEAKVKMGDLAFGRQSYPEIQVVREKGDEMRLVEKKPAFFKPNVSMGLKVVIPRNLWVSAEQATIELKGELGILKAYGQDLTVTGAIESIRGTYKFYGRELTIQRATIQFQGLPEINPLLDMVTVYRVEKTNIFILITGTRKAPVIRLQSDDKTLSQDKIISLLVFGQPLENLNQREATSLQGEAFALLGRVVATQVLGIFGEKLPVDTVQIRASKEGTGTLEVGKYLTRNIFVSFGQEFGQEKGSEQIIVEYYLYSNLTLEAEIRKDQRSGVDLIWKKDF